ncbi:UbiA prenyltransferase family protein [Patescibacteria group bacterium]|nr:UbiA prenyltransferase family protein [Patescibacteria group bacterium]
MKNFALFAALVFTRTLLIHSYFVTVVWAFIAFSLATSSTYILNDILDVKADRLHPNKKLRPIAAGTISPIFAFTISAALAFVSLFIASSLNTLFFYSVVVYIVTQIFYSLGLKNIAIIDILIIAFGFIIRVYAGAFVIDAHLSVWFLLTVISVALFLASGKRRAEFGGHSMGETRKSLSKYKRELLNSYVTMFGNAAWMSWALFTFFESPPIELNLWLFLAEISKATTISKLLMVTIPVVIFIIMRYENLIFEDRTEAPEKVLLTDKPLIIAVALYAFLVISILYSGATP